MNDNGKNQTDSLAQILDNSPFAVYVNSLETWELLYYNDTAVKLMPGPNRSLGTPCYRTMGFDRPCPYCKVPSMQRNKTLTREFYNPILKRSFRLDGKLIDWNGIPAHIEYIIDITEQKEADKARETLSEDLQSILKNIPGGVCVYRFDDQKITPVFHNDEFYRLLGYSDTHIFEMQEQTANLNVHPDDVDELNRKIFEAIRSEGKANHIYRVFNDKLGIYRWIRLDGLVKRQEDGSYLLYGLYNDVDEQRRLEQRLAEESIRTQNIINAIPGGVALFRVPNGNVKDGIETIYLSDGVPELFGYTTDEYRELTKKSVVSTIYPEDRERVLVDLGQAIKRDATADLEYREKHRDGRIVWIRAQIKKISENDGAVILQSVFHNITELKEARQELDHIVNSIPGGIAVFRLEDGKFKTNYYTDGVADLIGCTREEYDRLFQRDSFENLYSDEDRMRVKAALHEGLANGTRVELSYRRKHKDGHPVWVHLSAKWMGAAEDRPLLYAVITGMSAETKLFQNIANDTADGIYVVDANNYDLLYANESVRLFMAQDANPSGKKCYAALHGKTEPCEFCTLKCAEPNGKMHEMKIPGSNRTYHTRFRSTDWNGIPAYIKFVSDVTEEEKVRRQKERLEQYFQTMVKILPGGVAVVRYDIKLKKTIPEFISDGFAALCGMTSEEAWALHGSDSGTGIHPDDEAAVMKTILGHLDDSNGETFKLIYRLLKHDGSYFWVKNTSTVIRTEGDPNPKIYSTYSDISQEVAEQERMRTLYNEMLFQHHRPKDPNLIIAGHSNLNEKRIIQITDRTENNLIRSFGDCRDDFFKGLAGFISDESERQAFLDLFLTDPLTKAFAAGITKRDLDCFIAFPNEKAGRYIRMNIELITSPYTNEIMGIFSVFDDTARRISERILHRLANTSYDFIVDGDLITDSYKVISYDKDSVTLPSEDQAMSASTFINSMVTPSDYAVCDRKLNKEYIEQTLAEKDSYSFHYTMKDQYGVSYTKNMIVFYIDKRLKRVCFARIDITDSVREQKQLLNILAYTFDLACFIDVATRSFTMHTRDTVLNDTPPYFFDDYDKTAKRFTLQYGTEETRDEVRRQFDLDYMLKHLKEHPDGYEFMFPYEERGAMLYKQVNVLFGDANRQTICMVRADVTETLTAEQRTKEHLKNTLAIAQEANRAKTDFLSSMSHDIRTPMNAIVGMTNLAIADKNNPRQIDESLSVIKSSSEHLLKLISDILDMNRIESGKLVLSKEPFNQTAELRKVVERAQALAVCKKIEFTATFDIRHDDCIGDAMRISEVLDNLIGNAIKFTPEGGRVSLTVTELPEKNFKIGWYRYIVADNGVGMTSEALKRIYEPFYRAETSNMQTEGTGLGLSIVKSIVDYKGGIMSVDSEPGKGTHFIVDLPLHFSEAAAVAPKVETAPETEQKDLHGARILLVEDHPINQLVAQKILENMNARVTVTANGEAGYKTFEASATDEFDAICMDIQMPVMNGYESARAIRACAHPRAKTVPILAMTANAFAGDVKKCLDAGMNAHIAKPIDAETLYRLLKNHISRV